MQWGNFSVSVLGRLKWCKCISGLPRLSPLQALGHPGSCPSSGCLAGHLWPPGLSAVLPTLLRNLIFMCAMRWETLGSTRVTIRFIHLFNKCSRSSGRSQSWYITLPLIISWIVLREMRVSLCCQDEQQGEMLKELFRFVHKQGQYH